MDAKKTKRVRRLIASGFYSDPDVLDSILQVVADRHCGRLIDDVQRCVTAEQNSCDEQAAGVHAQAAEDLMQCQIGGGRRHNVVANAVGGWLRKLAGLFFAGRAVNLRPR